MSSLPVIAHVASGLIFMVKHWTTTRKWERFTVMLRSVVFYNSQRKTHTRIHTVSSQTDMTSSWSVIQSPLATTATKAHDCTLVYQDPCGVWACVCFLMGDLWVWKSWQLYPFFCPQKNGSSLSFFSFDCDCLSLTFTLRMLCFSFIVTFKSSQTNTLLVTSQPFCSTKHQEK